MGLSPWGVIPKVKLPSRSSDVGCFALLDCSEILTHCKQHPHQLPGVPALILPTPTPEPSWALPPCLNPLANPRVRRDEGSENVMYTETCNTNVKDDVTCFIKSGCLRLFFSAACLGTCTCRPHSGLKLLEHLLFLFGHATQRVGSSLARDQTHVPCAGNREF